MILLNASGRGDPPRTRSGPRPTGGKGRRERHARVCQPFSRLVAAKQVAQMVALPPRVSSRFETVKSGFSAGYFYLVTCSRPWAQVCGFRKWEQGKFLIPESGGKGLVQFPELGRGGGQTKNHRSGSKGLMTMATKNCLGPNIKENVSVRNSSDSF